MQPSPSKQQITRAVPVATQRSLDLERRVSERRQLYRQATRAAALGWAVNFVLGLTKLIGGWLGNSLALISDAVNSFGDVFVSTVVLVGLRVAQRPVSSLHPYGYLRAEAIAASNVALLVILSALAIGWQACQRWQTRHDVPALWTLAIALGNFLIKELLYRYKVQVGNRTGSTALIANAWDHRGDALCSLAVVVGLGVVRWGGVAWSWADEAAALVVAAAILITGVALFHKSARELMDAQADDAFVQQVRQAALSVSGVQGVEKLWVRKAGLEYFVDIHIEVPPETSVANGHETGHRVKDHLLEQFVNIRDVLVHLEPCVGHEPHSPSQPPPMPPDDEP